jgi:Sulfotransferase family
MARQSGSERVSRRRSVRPVFVVTPARSGSTLLRYLLDSHPEVVSPPELNLSDLLQHLVNVWTNLNASSDAPTNGAAPADITPDVAKRARKAVDEIMVSAANEAGASVYCDKSLTTVDHLATISRCYPRATLIFLYRYPLDMIASGLEASKWGFNAFGFAPFIAASPGNFVAGLANYWIDRVSKMVTFERTCELPHARLYYELLCDDPKGTLEELFEFLGLPADDTVIERMFETRHGVGPGDYKIDYSGRIAVDSIGRGATLPEHMSEAQVTRINELLAELDYPDLESGRRGNLGLLLGLKRTGAEAPAARDIADEIVRRLAARPHDSVSARHLEALPIRLAIRDGRGERSEVVVGKDGRGEIAERDAQNGSIPGVRCIGDVLLRVADGEITFARAVHENLIRVEFDHGPEEERPARPHRFLAALAALIRDDGS